MRAIFVSTIHVFKSNLSAGNCCAASVASEQQHKQDLRRGYEFSKSSLFTRLLCGCFAAFYNALRLLCGFLPDCFAAFYQNALRLLPECIAPRTTLGCVTVVMASFCCVDCGRDRLVMVCFDLPVKRCERDRAWLSQPLLLSSMQNLKVWISGRLIVTS